MLNVVHISSRHLFSFCLTLHPMISKSYIKSFLVCFLSKKIAFHFGRNWLTLWTESRRAGPAAAGVLRKWERRWPTDVGPPSSWIIYFHFPSFRWKSLTKTRTALWVWTTWPGACFLIILSCLRNDSRDCGAHISNICSSQSGFWLWRKTSFCSSGLMYVCFIKRHVYWKCAAKRSF